MRRQAEPEARVQSGLGVAQAREVRALPEQQSMGQADLPSVHGYTRKEEPRRTAGQCGTFPSLAHRTVLFVVTDSPPQWRNRAGFIAFSPAYHRNAYRPAQGAIDLRKNGHAVHKIRANRIRCDPPFIHRDRGHPPRRASNPPWGRRLDPWRSRHEGRHPPTKKRCACESIAAVCACATAARPCPS